MIPNMIVPVTDLPLNPKGKTDYSKLLPNQSNYLGDNSDFDTKIANIWTDVLHLHDGKILYPHDNFFDLTSQSIDFIHLVLKVEKEFNIKLSLNELREKESLTVPSMVEIIKQNKVSQDLGTLILRQLEIL